MSRQLEALNRATEQDFVAVGAKLEDVLGRTRDEAAGLARLLNAVNGEQGRTLAGALSQVASWAEHSGNTSGCGQLLAELMPAVRAVVGPLNDLRGSVRVLRLMSVVTRMESARLGERAADFDSLGHEVIRLAETVDSKAEAIVRSAGDLRALLGANLETAVELERRQSAELPRLVTESAAGLDALGEDRKRVAEYSRRTQACYEQITARINDMVIALQFHDSTRQRIEHVAAALDQLAGGLTAGGSPAAAAVVADATQLQAAQLCQARDTFLESVDKILRDLEEMESSVANSARGARDLAGGATGGESFVAGVERHFSAVERSLTEWAVSRQALSRAGNAVTRACSEMSGSVSQIENVGIAMLRLSLNAEIQAVRLAGSGAVMEAVAAGIRGLAHQASQHAACVSRLLRDVEAAAGRLNAALNGEMDSGSHEAEELATRIRTLAAGLREASAGSRQSLVSMAEGGESLAVEIAALRRGITAHQMMSQVVAESLETLEEAGAAARAASGTITGAQRAVALELAGNNYTMHAEREVHKSLVGAGAAPAGAAGVTPPAASEFGDNVELF